MTEPVKRYLVPQSILLRDNASFGESVVLAADYACLEQECERLRALLARSRSSYRALLSDCGLKHSELIAEIDAALSAKP